MGRRSWHTSPVIWREMLANAVANYDAGGGAEADGGGDSTRGMLGNRVEEVQAACIVRM